MWEDETYEKAEARFRPFLNQSIVSEVWLERFPFVWKTVPLLRPNNDWLYSKTMRFYTPSVRCGAITPLFGDQGAVIGRCLNQVRRDWATTRYAALIGQFPQVAWREEKVVLIINEGGRNNFQFKNYQWPEGQRSSEEN